MSFEALGLAWMEYHKSLRDSWEQTRIIAFYTAAPHLKEDPTMKQFMPLGWDTEEDNKPATDSKADEQRFNYLIQKLNLHGK